MLWQTRLSRFRFTKYTRLSSSKSLTAPFAQRAVERHDGISIISGAPGCGKTSFVSDYIMKAVKIGNYKPSRILCLSASAKTNYEIQDLLDSLQHAPENQSALVANVLHVNFETFDSLAETIFDQQCLAHGLPQTKQILNRYDLWRSYLIDNLFKLPLQEYRPLGEPWSIAGNLAQYMRRLYAIGLDGETYETFARLKVNDSLGVNKRQHEVFGPVVKQVEHEMTRSGIYDPAYQLLCVTNWLRANPSALFTHIGSKYDLVVVDDWDACSPTMTMFISAIGSKAEHSVNGIEAELLVNGNETEHLVNGNEAEHLGMGNETEHLVNGNETEHSDIGNKTKPPKVVLVGVNQSNEYSRASNDTNTVLQRNSNFLAATIPSLQMLNLRPKRREQMRLRKLDVKVFESPEKELHGLLSHLDHVTQDSTSDEHILVVTSTPMEASSVYETIQSSNESFKWNLETSSQKAARGGSRDGTGIVPLFVSFLHVLNDPNNTTALFRLVTQRITGTRDEIENDVGTQLPFSTVGPIYAKAKRMHLSLWEALNQIASHSNLSSPNQDNKQRLGSRLQHVIEEINLFRNIIDTQPSIAPSELVLLYLSRSKLGDHLTEPASHSEENCLEEVEFFLSQLVQLEKASLAGECILPRVLDHLESRVQYGMSQLYQRQHSREQESRRVESSNSKPTISVVPFYEASRVVAHSIDHLIMLGVTSSKFPKRTIPGLPIDSELLNFAENYHKQYYFDSYQTKLQLPRGTGFPLLPEERLTEARLSIDRMVSRVRQDGTIYYSYAVHKTSSKLGPKQRISPVVAEAIEDHSLLVSDSETQETSSTPREVAYILDLHNNTTRNTLDSMPGTRSLKQVRKFHTSSTTSLNAEMGQLLEMVASTHTAGTPPKAHKSRSYVIKDNILPVSFSSLYEYDWCPQRYLFSRSYQLPSPPNPHMLFGTLVHEGLRGYHDVCQASPDANLASRLVGVEQSVLSKAEKLFSVHQSVDAMPQGFLSREHVQSLRDQALRVSMEWAHRRADWEASLGSNAPIPVYVEKRFRFIDTSMDLGDVNVQIAGVWDLVEKDPSTGAIDIVDYKTNVHTGSKLTRLVRNNALQLGLYAWAFRELNDGRPAERLALEGVEIRTRRFLGENTRTKKVDPDAVETAVSQAKETVQKVSKLILSEMFDPTPSRSKCWSCGYREFCPDSVV